MPVADVYDFFQSTLSGSYSSGIQKRVDFVGAKPRWSIKAAPLRTPSGPDYTSEVYKVLLQADSEAVMDSMIADFLQRQSLYLDVEATWQSVVYEALVATDNYGDPNDETSPYTFGYDDTEGDEHDWYLWYTIAQASISAYATDYRFLITPQASLGAAYSPLYLILCNDLGQDGGSIGTTVEWTNTSDWTEATELTYACSSVETLEANFALFGTDNVTFLLLGEFEPPITTIAVDFQQKVGWPFFYCSVKETGHTRHHTELEVEVRYHA